MLIGRQTSGQTDIERWTLESSDGIAWKIDAGADLPHADHFAMSGRTVDIILEWAVDAERKLSLNRVVRWPMLRTLPDDTHASLQREIAETAGVVRINGEPLADGIVTEVRLEGAFGVTIAHDAQIREQLTIFPSVHAPALIERHVLENIGGETVVVKIPTWTRSEKTKSEGGVFGRYHIEERSVGDGVYHVSPGERIEYAVIRAARLDDAPPYVADARAEWAARRDFVERLEVNLVLETPDEVLNRLFGFSKLRATESIFATRGGLMHGPGGYNKYLAAIWANDEAEYANPFFPFLGDAAGNESALNSFRMFARHTNPAFKAIPSSIIAEGRDSWSGAGDRGDAAMIAYGAARFALAAGNRDWAEELWPLVEWCLEYCRRQLLPSGVVASDSDELEDRFPAGAANLATSSLYYDGLLSAALLGETLGKDGARLREYRERADTLRDAIESYFGATVGGYETYRYYEGNEALRSWICIPLTVGITRRAEGTLDALFSERLWTSDGLLTEAGTSTVWDRSTLYALRGAFEAGAADRALGKLKRLSRARLLGEHVPYLMESNAEYNRSQLSAEAALYCRIFTEGLFGIRPTGLNSFECKPSLPSSWSRMALRKIHAFGRTWDLHVIRDGAFLKIVVKNPAGEVLFQERTHPGEGLCIQL